MMAINPLDHDELVVGFNDLQGDIHVGWSWSANGGAG